MNSIVSVIVPVYQACGTLKRCVDSILNQTYKDYEIILVDDGSPDESSVICDEYATLDHRIKVFHKNNGGLSSARLDGYKMATGDYILFVDSDDTIRFDMVEKLLNAIQEQNADMAICGYNTVRSDIKEPHLLPYDSLTIEDIAEHYTQPLIGTSDEGINIPGFIWIRLLKRKLIHDSFFESERKYYAEDIVFDLLYAREISRIAVVNEPLYNYYVNDSSLTLKYRQNKWDMFYNLYQFKKKYCNENSISMCEERLNNSLGSVLFAGIDNAVRTGSYKGFVDELCMCLDKAEAEEVLDATSKIKLSNMQKAEIILIKSKMYRLLYWLRKSRMQL